MPAATIYPPHHQKVENPQCIGEYHLQVPNDPYSSAPEPQEP